MSKLIAYHGKQEIKDKYVARMKAHKLADEIIHGNYWDGVKGCAVGCTLHSDKHSDYETELGVPRILAKLEDGIFESLRDPRDKEWPLQFLEAIPVGADLSNIWTQFAVWMLIDEKWGVLQFAKTDRTKESIKAVAKFYSEGKFAKKEHWDEIAKIRATYASAAAAAATAYAYAAATASADYAAATTASAAYATYADYAAYATAASAAYATYADYAAYATTASAAYATYADYAAYATYATASYAATAYADYAASAYAYASASATASATAYADYAASASAYAYASASATASATAYATAYAYDRQKWREAQADKLLELMANAPVLLGV